MLSSQAESIVPSDKGQKRVLCTEQPTAPSGTLHSEGGPEPITRATWSMIVDTFISVRHARHTSQFRATYVCTW